MTIYNYIAIQNTLLLTFFNQIVCSHNQPLPPLMIVYNCMIVQILFYIRLKYQSLIVRQDILKSMMQLSWQWPCFLVRFLSQTSSCLKTINVIQSKSGSQYNDVISAGDCSFIKIEQSNYV